MANIFNHPFTAADGTLWTDADVAFEKVLGTTGVAGSVATISGNKGIAGTLGNESIYRSLYYDSYQGNLKASLSVKWGNAATQGRSAGVGVRVSSDGDDGYFLILDSNVGAPRIKLVRRKGGVMTSLGTGWVTPTEGPAELNAGVTLTLRISTESDGFHLSGWIGSNLYFDDIVDVEADGVGGLGTAGVYIDATVVTTDITFDDLSVDDFEDEAPSTAWQEGIGLVINGTYYSEAEWEALGLDPVVARRSIAPAQAGTILDLNDAGSPALRVGAWVKILKDGDVLSEGLLQQAPQTWPPPESITYNLTSPRELGEDVLLSDPDTGANFIAFNQEDGTEFYKADRANKTVGDVLLYLYQQHAAAMREKKAGPASGPVYTGSFAALDAVVPNLTVSGTLLQAEETLLALMPEYAINVDPDTRQRSIIKRSTATTRQVKTSECHTLPSLSRDLTRNRTAIVIYGTTPDAEETSFLWDPADAPGSTLTPLWDRSLEGAYTADKAKRSLNHGTIVGFGVQVGGPNAGYAYVDLDTAGSFSMDEHEWAGTLLGFSSGAAAPGTYKIRDNNTSRVWLTATSFTTAPSVSDTVYLTGVEDPAYSRNGYDAMFKEFDLGGGKIGGRCGDAFIKHTVGTKTVTLKSKVRRFTIDNGDGTTRDGIRLDLPAIGLINSLGTLCGETGGIGATPAESVEVTLPITSASAIPKRRVPTLGYRGTAYTEDPAKWDGGGSPGVDDPGCVRELPLAFPDFKSDALQGAEYEKVADAILAAYGTLAVSGTVPIHGIDPTWTLDRRVQFIDDEATSRPTGYEDSDSLWLMSIEFDLRDLNTTLGIGTLSSQGIDLDAIRHRYAERTRLDALRRSRELADQMRECLNRAFESFAGEAPPSSLPTPGCNVTSDVPGTSLVDRVSTHIDLFLLFLSFISELLGIQKGLSITNEDGTLKTEAELNDQIASLFAAGGGLGGIEGGILANLGKTIDNVTRLVVPPGTVLGAGGGIYYGPGGKVDLPAGATAPGSLSSKVAADNAAFFGLTTDPATGDIVDALGTHWRPNADGTWTEVGGSNGFPAPGGLFGHALGNLGKTIAKVSGAELSPGGTVPLGGAYHYGPGGGTPTYLAPGGTVPANAHTEAKAGEKALIGLTTPANSHSVVTPTHHGASVYIPNAAHGYTKVSGTGLAGPSFGGLGGNLAGKCGTTLDGKGDPGSGPGALLAPGATIGADGGYYYPPTQHAGDPDVVQLASGDEVPASSVDTTHALLAAIGLSVDSLGDAGGPVFTDGVLLYRVEASTKSLREVDAVMAGTGVNGGDYDWASPTAYYEIPVDVVVGAVKGSDAVLTGSLRLTGYISPTALGADQNDYNPTGLSTANVARLSTSGGARNITGMVPSADGHTLLVVNVGSNNITLVNNSVSSSAPNRFAFDADLVLAPGTGALLWYDVTSTAWRKALPAAGGGSGMTADTGWTAMAGTADKASTFNTETCTFRDLARRVKAIQDTLASNLRPNA